MNQVLHIVTRQDDPLTAEMIALHRNDPALHVQVVDLSAEAPDYAALLEKIFQADSIEVW